MLRQGSQAGLRDAGLACRILRGAQAPRLRAELARPGPCGIAEPGRYLIAAHTRSGAGPACIAMCQGPARMIPGGAIPRSRARPTTGAGSPGKPRGWPTAGPHVQRGGALPRQLSPNVSDPACPAVPNPRETLNTCGPLVAPLSSVGRTDLPTLVPSRHSAMHQPLTFRNRVEAASAKHVGGIGKRPDIAIAKNAPVSATLHWSR